MKGIKTGVQSEWGTLKKSSMSGHSLKSDLDFPSTFPSFSSPQAGTPVNCLEGAMTTRHMDTTS